MESTLAYFTDASYSPAYDIGVVGYMRGDDQELHLDVLKGVKNTQCEHYAFLQACSDALHAPHSTIVVYTDCAGTVGLFRSREIPTKRARYPDFFTVVDALCAQKTVRVEKVRGHSKKSEKKEEEVLFQRVDKAVRKALRAELKRHHLREHRIHRKLLEARLKP